MSQDALKAFDGCPNRLYSETNIPATPRENQDVIIRCPKYPEGANMDIVAWFDKDAMRARGAHKLGCGSCRFSEIECGLNEEQILLAGLHTKIFECSSESFASGQYVSAIRDSFTEVLERLRELTGHERAFEAFGKKGRLYIDGNAAEHVDDDLQEASKELMQSINSFRNEFVHISKNGARNLDFQSAYEYLALSSLAMRLLDNAKIKD